MLQQTVDKPIAICDLDCVVVDLFKGWLQRYNADYGDNVTVADIASWDMTKLVKPEFGMRIYDYLSAPGFFASLPIYDGAAEMVARMNEDYDFFFASDGRGSTAASEKQAWVDLNFPKIGRARTAILPFKHRLNGDIMLDDGPHNLDSWHGVKVKFAYRYNESTRSDFTVNGCAGFLEQYDSILEAAKRYTRRSIGISVGGPFMLSRTR